MEKEESYVCVGGYQVIPVFVLTYTGILLYGLIQVYF